MTEEEIMMIKEQSQQKWDGSNPYAYFCPNDFLVEAHRCGVPAAFIQNKDCLYLVMAPDYDILKHIQETPKFFEKIIKDCSDSKKVLHMYGQCYKVSEKNKNLFPADQLFSFYQNGMRMVQNYSTALHAYRFAEINPLPKYCWVADVDMLVDLNLKRTNKNIGAIMRNDYDGIFKKYARMVAQKSRDVEKYESERTKYPVQGMDKLVFVNEWKKHEVDNIMYFVERGIEMKQIQISEQVFEYIKKKMKGTGFIFYHIKELDYELKDNSKFTKDLGNKNIWADDGKCKTINLIYPERDDGLFASWLLEKRFTDSKVFIDEWIKPNYCPYDEMIKETKADKLLERKIHKADWDNIVSLTKANNVKITCDFDGSKTGQKRTMEDTETIPVLIKQEDIEMWNRIEITLQRAKREHIPIGHLDPVGTMEEELKKQNEKDVKIGWNKIKH